MEDLMMKWMSKHNIPINRETYIMTNHLGDASQHGAEREADLPNKIRYQKFDTGNVEKDT